MSTQPFAEFLKTHHQTTSERLRELFQEQAFLLVLEPGSAPQIATLERGARVVIGSGPEAAVNSQGLSETHCVLRYHSGFSSWIVEAIEPTGVCGSLAPKDRPLVLNSRDELRFPTSKVRVQFYEGSSLVDRLRKAGATKRLKRPAVEAPQPSPAVAPAPKIQETRSAERPSRRMSRAASNGVSWGD